MVPLEGFNTCIRVCNSCQFHPLLELEVVKLFKLGACSPSSDLRDTSLCAPSSCQLDIRTMRSLSKMSAAYSNSGECSCHHIVAQTVAFR